jgi:hypothetical protein
MVTPLPALAGLSGWIDPRRQALLGLASGLVSGNTLGEALGTGFARAAQGKQADDAYKVAEEAKAEREKQLNYTIQAFQKAGRQDLVDMANAGMMSEAWNQFNKPKKSPIEVNGQLVDPDTYELLGDFRDPEDVAGSGQTEYGLTPIWGQFQDGSFGYGVQGKDGSFKKVDTGDLKILDPRTLNTEKGIGTTVGKGIGTRELAAPSMEVNLQRLDSQTDNIINTIDKAAGQSGWWETGLPGAVMGGVPGTGAYDLRKTVTTIKANLGFAELQAMRDASPTGGALGQVAIQELEALQSTLANLDPNQSEEQMKENLALVKQLLERQKMYRRMAAEAKYGVGGEEPAAPGSDIDSILGGYGL